MGEESTLVADGLSRLSFSLAAVFNSLGQVYFQQGRLENVESAYAKSIAITEKQNKIIHLYMQLYVGN